jgi:hypothetical protein
MVRFFNNTPVAADAGTLIESLNEEEIASTKESIAVRDPDGLNKADGDLTAYLEGLDENAYHELLKQLPVEETKKFESGFSLFRHKIPTWIFILVCIYLAVLSFRKNLSLIPLLGLVSCLYMMSEMGVRNWIGFSIWLIAGLIIYFAYSRRNSKLNVRS